MFSKKPSKGESSFRIDASSSQQPAVPTARETPLSRQHLSPRSQDASTDENLSKVNTVNESTEGSRTIGTNSGGNKKLKKLTEKASSLYMKSMADVQGGKFQVSLSKNHCISVNVYTMIDLIIGLVAH